MTTPRGGHEPAAGGVLVVRAWSEPGATPALRARITSRVDATQAEQEQGVTVCSDPEQVLAAVRAWLAAVTLV